MSLVEWVVSMPAVVSAYTWESVRLSPFALALLVEMTPIMRVLFMYFFKREWL